MASNNDLSLSYCINDLFVMFHTIGDNLRSPHLSHIILHPNNVWHNILPEEDSYQNNFHILLG